MEPEPQAMLCKSSAPIHMSYLPQESSCKFIYPIWSLEWTTIHSTSARIRRRQSEKPSHSGRSEALAVCNTSNIWHVRLDQ